jgi:hypothetical protein
VTAGRRSIAAGALLVSLAAAPAAQARPPANNEFSYRWTKFSCTMGSDGYFHSIGTIKTYVHAVERPDVRYYQKVTVQIDRQAGFAGTTWRKVAKRTWSWSQFTVRDLPTYSTSSVRTGLQPDAANLTAKATVKLKRVRRGYDTTVWEYQRRSPVFSCENGITSISP